MIKAIIFDCFGVLYSTKRADFYAKAMPDYDEHKEYLYDLGMQADYGLISEQDMFEAVAERTKLGVEEIRIGLSGHQRNDALIDYMKELSTTYNIGMISNISSGAIKPYFSEEELKELFDDVVLSSDVGMVKPHPEIFVLAAQRLGFDTTECVFIDDIESNVKGAISVGMQGIVYQDINQLKHELSKILESSN